MPDALALVFHLVFVCFSISDISCYWVLIVVSSQYSFDFYVLGDVALMCWNPSRRLNKCLKDTTAEVRARVVGTLNRFKPPISRRCFCCGLPFLLLYVFTWLYVPIFFILRWIAVWSNFILFYFIFWGVEGGWKELFFWFSDCSVLIMGAVALSWHNWKKRGQYIIYLIVFFFFGTLDGRY